MEEGNIENFYFDYSLDYSIIIRVKDLAAKPGYGTSRLCILTIMLILKEKLTPPPPNPPPP